MMRYLKGNSGCSTPTNICCLDVEGTSAKVPEIIATEREQFQSVTARYFRYDAGQVSRCDTKTTTSLTAWWTHTANRMHPSRPLWIFCYDATRAMQLLGVLTEVDAGHLKVVTLIDGDPPVLCTLASEVGKMIWCDIRNWYRLPWQELCASIMGVSDGNDAPVAEECESESMSLLNAATVEQAVIEMLNFVRSHDLGNWRPTVAAQAMQLYRHKLGPRKVSMKLVNHAKRPPSWEQITQVWPLYHDKKDIHEFERSANYGGQDSCFFVGTIMDSKQEWSNGLVIGKTNGLPFVPGPVYYVDANSAYPYMMHNRKFPCKLAGYADSADVKHLEHLTAKYSVLANVCLHAWGCQYPVRHNNRILYATGEFWTTLCGLELDRALDSGHVAAVGYHICYDTMDLFTDYVEYLYGLKLEYGADGNQAYRLIVKLLLNSLYGKFGQRPRRWQNQRYPIEQDRWSRWLSFTDGKEYPELWRNVGGQTQRLDTTSIVPYGVPAISAIVTADVREYMRSVRVAADERNVMYQGTDGLLLTKEGYDNLVDHGYIHNTRLGALRLVAVYDSAEIRGPQDYTLGTERTVRGLPQDAEQVGKYTYQHKVRRGLAGIVSSVPSDTVAYQTVRKEYQPTFRYGHVGKDGWVTPYTLTTNERGKNVIT